MEADLAARIVSGLKEAGIDFMSYLPESRLSQILPLMRQESQFQLAPAASEADAVSVAVGATLAGKQAACYMESTGVYVSCYQLVVVALHLRVPVLLLVSHLGGFDDQRNTFLYSLPGRRLIPQLKALDIEYKVLENGNNLETDIMNAVRTMNSLREPVALVFSGDFTL
ncbi:MAG TPA: thiamine pyrophosphate-binding protein [Candidatus Binatia bacterium]|jgi:sulfopyruvate decarboxylase TPP-binding subunit